MKYKNKKTVLYALLLSLVTAKVSGCGYNNENKITLEIEKIEDSGKETQPKVQKLEIEQTENISIEETTVLEEVQPVEEVSLFKEISSVVATSNVNIRKSPSTDGELAGKLVEGHTLEMVEKLSNGWYKVLYYGEERYVSGDFVSETTTYQVNGEIKKVCYATDEMEMTIPSEVSKSGNEEKVIIPSLECLEIYEENEDNYLAQTNDYIGYVAKTSLEELTGTFVVVDISDQELKLYENNKLILETPVITGNVSKGNSTHQGLHTFYNITYDRPLIGPGYSKPVDVMMKFYNNEGVHDAEIEYDETLNKIQGWREVYQFGGDTYLYNGSGGCVNALDEAAKTIDYYIQEDDYILIKQ